MQLKSIGLAGFVLAMLVLAFQQPAYAEKRLALVLGNDTYSDVPQLQKAANDAKALEAKLTGLGFEVISGVNLNRRDTVRKIQDLASRIKVGDKVVFFYAGHGVQIDRSNYLLATDIPATSGIEEEFVRFEGFDVQKILDMIRGRGAQTTVMILDACRNNPFESSEATRAIGGLTRGLVPIRKVNEGTFIMYSADEGQEAFDSLGAGDTSNNSVFTRNLLTLLDEPDLELTDITKQVRLSVYQTVHKNFPNKSQEPFYVDRLFGEFYFHAHAQSDEELFWNSIKDNKTAASFKVYLQVYPDGKFKTEAEKRVKELGALEPGPGQMKVKHASFIPSQTMAVAGSLLDRALSSWKEHSAKETAETSEQPPVVDVALKNHEPIFPNSSSVMLTDNDVGQLSCLELWLARNEIYDRNGYCFVTPLGIQYFDNANCRTTSTNILRNWTENQNVKLIQSWEKKKHCIGQ